MGAVPALTSGAHSVSSEFYVGRYWGLDNGTVSQTIGQPSFQARIQAFPSYKAIWADLGCLTQILVTDMDPQQSHPSRAAHKKGEKDLLPA